MPKDLKKVRYARNVKAANGIMTTLLVAIMLVVIGLYTYIWLF